MKYLLTFCAFVWGLSSCLNPDNSSVIVAAEKLMQERPDSALTLLQSIDRQSLRGEHRKARFALLYSQALDKNYIDIDNDSLIRPAVKYFEHHGTNADKRLAFYYLGRVQYNAQNYTGAVISYTQAKEYAKRQGDHYFLGLIYSQLGDIYSIYYNYPSSIEAYDEAYKHYCQTASKEHQQYALLDVAAACEASKQYDKTLQVTSELLHSPEIATDTLLQTACLSLRALVYSDMGQMRSAKESILTLQNRLDAALNLNDYLILAHIFAKENKPDSVKFCLGVARQYASSANEHASIILTEYKINKALKNYFKAFENLEQCMRVQDSLARVTLDQSVISAQRDYYEGKSEFTAYQLKVNKYYGLLLLCIFILLIAGVIAYYFHMRKVKNLEIAEYMAIAHRMQDTLETVQESMQKKDEQTGQMADLIQHLFKERFELIDRLGNTYYERQNSKSERDAIFNDVKAEIKKLGSDREAKRKLEQIINACKGDVMRKIREQIPEIKEEDFELLCYIFAGFSCRAISIFTQDKVENLYTRKSRLKSKILKSDAPDKDFLISVMP